MGRRLFAGLVAALFFYIASPLLVPLVMGGILAILFIPWLEKLEKRKLPTQAGAGILTLAITVLLLMPSSVLIFLGARAGVQEFQSLKNQPAGGGFVEALINAPLVQRLLTWIQGWYPLQMQDLVDSAQELAKGGAARIAEGFGEFLTHLPGMAMAMAIIIISVYFFLVDGRRLVLFLRRNSFFSVSQTDRLMDALAEICRSVLLAAVASGLAQTVLFTFFLLITVTPNVSLVALLVFLASFIPLVGAVPITLGVAIQQLLAGRTAAGVILLIAVLLSAALDNIIRPVFLQGRANLHPLLAFVAAFGGLQTIGFVGIFVGPVVAALFVVTVEILLQDRED
ncbi:MAG: AI-2E family transporter, partial [Bdellovibrionota bacterium]